MIAHLTGTVWDIADTSVILDVQGVGYQVFCSTLTRQNLPPVGSAASLHIEMVVREDLLQLYGFATALEKNTFQLLRTVQGVGMKMALSLLSVLRPEDLLHAIAQQDKTRLTQADGVGAKLALRMCTELKDKITQLTPLSNVVDFPTARTTPVVDDVVSVLINLGYKKMEAQQAAQKSFAEQDHESVSVDQLIRLSLQKLAR